MKKNINAWCGLVRRTLKKYSRDIRLFYFFFLSILFPSYSIRKLIYFFYYRDKTQSIHSDEAGIICHNVASIMSFNRVCK